MGDGENEGVEDVGEPKEAPKVKDVPPCRQGIKIVCGGPRMGGTWFRFGPYLVKRLNNDPEGEILRYRDTDGTYKDGSPPVD